MKNLTFLFSFLAITAGTSFAQTEAPESRDCETKIKQILQKRKNAMNITAGGGFLGTIMVGATIGSVVEAPIILPLAFASVGVAESVLAIEVKHTKDILNLIAQARAQDGIQINRLYQKFAEKRPVLANAIGFEGFCEDLIVASENGDLCRYEAVPEKRDIIEAIEFNLDRE